ncbi:DUF5677 domain-containing protein [Heyndrickxia oleronia]|uniref:DUF5677 domain-containing protein n=1 Tax=Heyndrickxia oleronia TaxID=38875 RepID=UPI001C0EA216|nr:DUF5677 domain-containing protein [Heyndrickxia oleronia]MBU5214936.1 hypothetical protein [Heyndrickxia oleronia]
MKLLKKLLKEATKSTELVFSKAFPDENSKFDIHDGVILGLFEDMIKKIESLVFLIDNEKFASTDSITRNIMENYVYLRTIFSNDYKLYTRSYFASIKLKETKDYKKIISQDKTGNEIRNKIGTSISDLKKLVDFENPDDRIQDIKDRYSDVFNLRKENQNWYNLDGKTKNFEQLCIKNNLIAEYELAYRILSKEVHAMDIFKRFDIYENLVHLLEDSKDTKMLIAIVSKFLLDTIESLYQFYNLRDELKKFKTLLKLNYRYMKIE